MLQCFVIPPPLILPADATNYQNKQRFKVPFQSLVPAIQLLDITPLALHQDIHFYYFNMINRSQEWFGTVITKYKNLTTPQELRRMRTFLPRISNGGWHLTYMGGANKVMQKMYSNVDETGLVNKLGEKLVNTERIQKMIEEGKWVFTDYEKADKFLSYCDIEQIKLPYLMEFIKKYPYFVKNDTH